MLKASDDENYVVFQADMIYELRSLNFSVRAVEKFKKWKEFGETRRGKSECGREAYKSQRKRFLREVCLSVERWNIKGKKLWRILYSHCLPHDTKAEKCRGKYHASKFAACVTTN